MAVFGSSNFPFAFSVAGGDSASAIAAGNPIVVKAHGSHLLTSKLSFETLSAAADTYGGIEGIIGIVYGTEAGRVLVAEPRIAAVGFTGSLGGGQALLEIINRRPEPIPFYGELSSINPLIVTPSAAAERAGAIGEGLFVSFTLGAGQFCTKPGIAFLPNGPDGEAVVKELSDRATAATGMVLLNERISSSLTEIVGRLSGVGAARVIASGAATSDGGIRAVPTVLEISINDFSPSTAEEAFGPVIVAVRFDTLDQVYAALDSIPSSLTATVHYGENEPELVRELSSNLAPRVGRVVFNGFPTGVRVSWAQHHGGNWPSTNSQHSSVGVSAIRRFLRPVAFQDAPAEALPEELLEDYSLIPRRVDGRLVLPQ